MKGGRVVERLYPVCGEVEDSEGAEIGEGAVFQRADIVMG